MTTPFCRKLWDIYLHQFWNGIAVVATSELVALYGLTHGARPDWSAAAVKGS